MWGVMITRFAGKHYDSGSFADETIYDSMVSYLSTEKGRKASGLELVCGIKVADDFIDSVADYAGELTERANSREEVDIKKELEDYCREICPNFSIH